MEFLKRGRYSEAIGLPVHDAEQRNTTHLVQLEVCIGFSRTDTMLATLYPHLHFELHTAWRRFLDRTRTRTRTRRSI